MQYETEEQQVEALKKWWKDNAKSVIGGVLIGVGVLLGGRAYIQQSHLHVESASAAFEAMMSNMEQNKNKEAEEIGAQILGQYVDTPYATMASMALAKLKLDAGDIATAKTHLRYALDHSEKEEVKHVIRLRLARLLLTEGKHDEALQLLNSVEPGVFKSSYEELKGDIYVVMGKVDEARNAYNIAMASLEAGSKNRNFLQMKIDDLGEVEISKPASSESGAS